MPYFNRYIIISFFYMEFNFLVTMSALDLLIETQ
jgi:hypothetical protein